MSEVRTVQVPDGHPHVESAGEGAPVVLIHPGPWDPRTWEDQLDADATPEMPERAVVLAFLREVR